MRKATDSELADDPRAADEAAMDTLLGWLAALAVCVHVLEAGLPSPLPGIKPGLANVVTLVVLGRYGFRAALWVAVLRVLVGSLAIGTFLTPTFVLSAAGAAASLGALGLGVAWSRSAPALKLSPIGLGVLAALSHVSAQFVTAWALFLPHPGLWTLLPMLLLAGLVTGLVTGWLAAVLLKALAKHPPLASATSVKDTMGQ